MVFQNTVPVEFNADNMRKITKTRIDDHNKSITEKVENKIREHAEKGDSACCVVDCLDELNGIKNVVKNKSLVEQLTKDNLYLYDFLTDLGFNVFFKYHDKQINMEEVGFFSMEVNWR